MSLVDMLDVAV